MLLIGMMLWCITLLLGALMLGFVGLAFAGEPGSGARVSGGEYLVAGTPLIFATLLTIGLFLLWQKGYFRTALGIWLLSIMVIVPLGYGYVF
jgi:hypothetical protein